MFEIMITKWMKRVLVFGIFIFLVSLLYDFFLFDYFAERRYLKDKKAMIENFYEHENSFDTLRLLSANLPYFELSFDDEIHLTIDLNEVTLTEEEARQQYFYVETGSYSQGFMNIMVNDKKWKVKIINSENYYSSQQLLLFFQNGFFEKITTHLTKVNSSSISNSKNSWLSILYKESTYQGLRYAIPYFDISKHKNENFFSGFSEKINEDFFLELYEKNSLFCGFDASGWIVPKEELE